jgi:hypothetical protein
LYLASKGGRPMAIIIITSIGVLIAAAQLAVALHDRRR